MLLEKVGGIEAMRFYETLAQLDPVLDIRFCVRVTLALPTGTAFHLAEEVPGGLAVFGIVGSRARLDAAQAFERRSVLRRQYWRDLRTGWPDVHGRALLSAAEAASH